MLPVRDTRGAACPIYTSVSVPLCFSHFCLVLFVFVYMSLSDLAFCPAVATPPLSTCSSLSRTRSGVLRMQKSRSSVPALPKMHYFKSDSVTMEVGMFRLMPGVLPSYSFIAVISIYSVSLCNSHSQLYLKWHASRPLDQFILVSQWYTADAEIKVSSVENPELTNVLPLKPGVG